MKNLFIIGAVVIGGLVLYQLLNGGAAIAGEGTQDKLQGKLGKVGEVLPVIFEKDSNLIVNPSENTVSGNGQAIMERLPQEPIDMDPPFPFTINGETPMRAPFPFSR